MPRAVTSAQRRAPTYAQRLDRVLDHVADHLDGDLGLAALARVAGFSPFHFHRLFQAHVGETAAEHVRRVRVERAASLAQAAPRRPLTQIALDVGFPALSDLSRAFKATFGVPPSKWDRRSPLPRSVHAAGVVAAAPAAGLRARTLALPRSLFVYERVFAPYGNQRLVAAYHRLHAWLDAIGRHDAIVAGMSLDDPSVVTAAKCRYDLGVLFPFTTGGIVAAISSARDAAVRPVPPAPPVVDAAGLSARRFPAIDLACVHVVGALDAVGAAWSWLYRTYLPGQPRLPANQPAMELFVRLPEEIGWERFDLFACVPLA